MNFPDRLLLGYKIEKNVQIYNNRENCFASKSDL